MNNTRRVVKKFRNFKISILRANIKGNTFSKEIYIRTQISFLLGQNFSE
jgi:hypothetical protein